MRFQLPPKSPFSWIEPADAAAGRSAAPPSNASANTPLRSIVFITSLRSWCFAGGKTSEGDDEFRLWRFGRAPIFVREAPTIKGRGGTVAKSRRCQLD